jgi:hypothetical protein
LARNLYLLGITHKRILEHGIGGGGPADTGSHEGGRWKQIYGVPFDLFVNLSNKFEAWLIKKGKYTYLKDEAPFKLRVMVCFWQLRLGGPLHQHHERCGLVTTVFRFFYFFLDRLWDIRTQHVKMPTTKEEIDHAEHLFCHVGYPGCLGSIDCIHVPWRKCTWTLQTQCKNKKKGCPTVVFEVVASHTTRVLHVSCMFWGCCSNALMVKFDEAVHEIMDGKYSTIAFEVSYIDGDKITDHGAFYNTSCHKIVFISLYMLFLTCYLLVK